MRKPALTVEKLLTAGFIEIGCWELNDARDLSHAIALPKRAGVYAFAVDNVVRYVGLASRSLHQRLNFYRRPGASQRTNVRLNEIIRGHLELGSVVKILVGHPSDGDWNGLTVSGPEGLEAGLISEFELPWNMRGGQSKIVTEADIRTKPRRLEGVTETIVELVKRRPGMTELEIAKAIYGASALQQQVNPSCRRLVGQGRLKRRGSGGASDPFVYHAAETAKP